MFLFLFCCKLNFRKTVLTKKSPNIPAETDVKQEQFSCHLISMTEYVLYHHQFNVINCSFNTYKFSFDTMLYF